MKIAKKLIFFLFLILLIVIFGYFYNLNSDVVNLDFVFHKFIDIQVGTVVVLSFATGVVFSVLYMAFELIKITGREYRLKRENKKLKKEIASLKSKYEPQEVEQEVLPEPIEDDEVDADVDEDKQ